MRMRSSRRSYLRWSVLKITRVDTLISAGPFASSNKWKQIRDSAHVAVRAADWPAGSGSFTIYPESGKKRGEGNGVKPIKDNAIRTLTGGKSVHGKLLKAGQTKFQDEWVAEFPWPVGERVKPGCIDAAYLWDGNIVSLEWETGNISSSHRSINKICLGLTTGAIKAGILVVPSRALYPYLTDRIGNIAELEPYFPLWRATPCNEGVFEIIVIEHDAVSRDVPRIPKGTDGRAVA